jgi:hypothetical protein
MNNIIMKVILLFLTIATGFDKLCMNCKHFKSDIFTPSRFGKCKKYLTIDDNVDYLINGKKKEKTENMHYCSTARKFDHLCGEEGTGYESKRVSK